VYSSSPLSYSFRKRDRKVVLIEAKPNEAVKYTGIPLQSGRTLHRKRFETIDNAVEWLLENPLFGRIDFSKRYFFATQDLKRIHESHDGIIYIIPIVTKDGNAEQQTPKVNLDQDIQGLFTDYFISKHKQEPNDELLICSMKLLEVKLKTNKKTPYVIKVKYYRFVSEETNN
jgi:exonuclease SbcD